MNNLECIEKPVKSITTASSTGKLLYGRFDYSKNKEEEKYIHMNKYENINKDYIVVNKTSNSNDKEYYGNVQIDGDGIMNNDDILMKYMDKVDKDQSELKQDIRESEKRTFDKIDNSETRMDDRLNRIEDMISKYYDNIDNKFDKLYEKVDKNNKYINTVSISTIIGIGAILVAVIFGLITFLNTILPLLKQ